MSASHRPCVRTVESLGKMSHETKPKTSNIVAGIIIAALLIGGGAFLAAFMIRQMFFGAGSRPQTASDWAGAAVLVVLGLGLMFAGVLLSLFVRSLIGFRLRICADGFYFSRRGVVVVFAWDDIVQVREVVLHEKLPLVKGAARRVMPTKTSRSYTVVRCDGEEFFFDANVISRTSLLAGPLSNAAKSRGFSWDTHEETR